MQGITIVTVHVPGDHIAREIVAGQGVEFGDHAPVLGGHVPQLVGAVCGEKCRRAAAAGLLKADIALAGGGVVQDLRGGIGGIAVQLHPVVQGIRRIGNAIGRRGSRPVGLGTVLLLDGDPAVQVAVVIPFVLGKVCRAGVAGEHQHIPADDAAVGTLRDGQVLAGGKVDDTAGAVAVIVDIVAVTDHPALLQHQQTVLDGGALLAVKGHHFVAVLVVQGAAAAAPAGGVRPGAEPVVRLAGDGVGKQVHVFAAGGLVQHLAAAQDGAAVAGVVVAVQDAQAAIVQPGGIVQGLALGVGGNGHCRGSGFLGGGRRHYRAAAAQRKAQGHAQGSTAQTGNGLFHGITPLKTIQKAM